MYEKDCFKRREEKRLFEKYFYLFCNNEAISYFRGKINTSNFLLNFGSFLHHCKNITLDNKIKGVLLIGK